MGLQKGKHRDAQALAERLAVVVPVEVDTVSQRVEVATGLTPAQAQAIFLQSPHWTYPEVRCVNCDRRKPSVMVESVRGSLRLVYCTECRQVDLWV